METATREPQVFKTQQVAALAAGMQNKLWYFIETFYHEQGEEDSGYVTSSYLRKLAQQVPALNLSLWEDDRHDPELASQVAEDLQAVRHTRFRGTPAVLIRLIGGESQEFNPSSLTTPASFDGAIEKLLHE